MLVRFFIGLALSQHLLCAGLRSICYSEMRQEFQCYDLWPPYTNSNWHLPASPSEQNIHFKLYTTRNPTSPQTVNAMDANSLRNSNWDSTRQTKFIVHGFTDSSNSGWIAPMVSELLQRSVNVILVDWSDGAKGPNYFQATANTRVVGAQIATLILTAGTLGAAPSTFHVIGHSLGAQIGGYVGGSLQGLGRITGLDPAAPLFESYDVAVRLDKGDATFVDVIHTDAQPLHEAGLGTVELIGHVDFFPNGGKDQPGCSPNKFNWVQLLTGQISALTDSIACSHNRATTFFTASINDNSFPSYTCASVAAYDGGACQLGVGTADSMGYGTPTSARGMYVLRTGSSYPFL